MLTTARDAVQSGFDAPVPLGSRRGVPRSIEDAVAEMRSLGIEVLDGAAQLA